MQATTEADGVLSTEEAFGVIDQICETGKPAVVLSGGEPLLREDIFAIARYGTEKGLRMVMGTSGYLDRPRHCQKTLGRRDPGCCHQP